MQEIRINRDRLNHASPKIVGQGVVAIADAVQKMPEHIRVLAAAGFLALLVERMKIAPNDVMTVLGNIRTAADKDGRVEFKAIEQYIKEDMGSGPRSA